MRLTFPNFRRLQWKLTLTYTLVTTAAILVVELVLLLVAGFLLARSETFPKIFVPMFEDAVGGLAPALEQRPVDTVTLDTWLRNLVQTGRLELPDRGNGSSMRLNIDPATITLAAIVDRDGRVLSVYPEGGCRRGALANTCVDDVGRAPLSAALRGEQGADRLVARNGGKIFLVTPIFSEAGALLGALVVRIDLPERLGQYPVLVVRSLLSSTLVIALFAAVIGTLFGFLTARGLTRRLHTLAAAADAWSRGDFSVVIAERSQDELGQLARRLNRMAEQLQNLLQAREELAALEERNRLARELHDSVKQQVFATVMQVAAARNMLAHDPEGARARLVDAEALARQAQQELTALIRELRPAALEGKGLATALETYVRDWSRQTGIRARVHIQGARALPLEVEQALFRVIQEALANVAKHSGADRVDVTLRWEDGRLLVRVEDNGQGFDVNAARGKGLGLVSMEERVQALGGNIQVDSSPGRGTRVSILVKVDDTATKEPG